MLKIFYGTDTLKAREALGKELERALRDDLVPIRIDEYSFNLETLKELLYARDLFGKKSVVVLDGVLERKESEEILELLPECVDSQNLFLLFAQETTAKLEKVFEKSTKDLHHFALTKKEGKPTFSVFAFADSFARRDRKTAWVLYMRAKMHTVSAQELIGTLVWQVRMILLAHTAKTGGEAGVADFSFQKARSFTKVFPKKDAEEVLKKLLGIYHFDPKENKGDSEAALEKLILRL